MHHRQQDSPTGWRRVCVTVQHQRNARSQCRAKGGLQPDTRIQ